MADTTKWDLRTYVEELLKNELSSKKNEENVFSETHKTVTGGHRKVQPTSDAVTRDGGSVMVILDTTGVNGIDDISDIFIRDNNRLVDSRTLRVEEKATPKKQDITSGPMINQ